MIINHLQSDDCKINFLVQVRISTNKEAQNLGDAC